MTWQDDLAKKANRGAKVWPSQKAPARAPKPSADVSGESGGAEDNALDALQAHKMASRSNEGGYIRVSTQPPPFRSKLEAEYAGLLQALLLCGEISGWWYEVLQFKLAPRTTLTPDFIVRKGDHLEVHETKGFRGGHFEDGWQKLKIAASMYPWFKWILVERRKGEWIFTQVGGVSHGEAH